MIGNSEATGNLFSFERERMMKVSLKYEQFRLKGQEMEVNFSTACLVSEENQMDDWKGNKIKSK